MCNKYHSKAKITNVPTYVLHCDTQQHMKLHILTVIIFNITEVHAQIYTQLFDRPGALSSTQPIISVN